MQQKWWSIFFGVVLLATFLLWVVAPFANWWLPANVASFGGDVDFLFYVILAFTGFFFVVTEAILVYNMYRYTYRPGQKADYVEGNHRLEIAWTLVPAAILLFIAFAQINAWERIKYISRMPEAQVVVQVTARQWDWSIRTPADAERFYVSDKTSDADKQIKHKEARHWAERTEMDDLVLPDELHTWKDANVKIYLRTQDVLHSFFLPNLRLKQDALPGKTIPMWFKATDHNCRYNADTGKTELTDPNKEWEIACAELCGGGHFRMRGKLYVHETKDEYLKWLTAAVKAQKTHKSDNPAGTPVAANTDR